ncbi:carbohydrate ABC transporter permease [Paenibacillus sp. MSJ-34]|uniref:carbohydrate ABC transporter permease n=1 Tax=Paenibacillus sp. MSJ-34 TaxID=2841529 RepID=UPI001C10F4E0|nr:carbohydrate ABC transporter permease [Paenibacillus sp. MSJ-34]MBU5441231.1 carbohydrate ABC transporter permease [Paenibacillus sp. MSJ-34]
MKKFYRLSGAALFDSANIVLLSLLGLLSVIPFLHVLAKSISDNAFVDAGKIGFWPKGFDLSSYSYVLFESSFFRSFGVTVFVTVFGTLAGLLITVLAAYPLSKPQFKGGKYILLLYIFSMLFYGGIVPSYMLMKELHLIDTVWAMIIPLLVVPFNLLVVKTFFEQVPEGLEEAAKMEGASNWRVLFSIILPISTPVLATIGLFYAVGYWNNYFHPLLFISKPELKPLQLYLMEMITSTSENIGRMSVEAAMQISTEGVRSATIIVSIVPVLIVYPFLQKYFVKGLTIGSVKG